MRAHANQVLFVVFLAACSDSNTRQTNAAQSSVRVEAVVARVSGSAPDAPVPTREWYHGPAWQLVHELTIGSIDDDGPTVFGSIAALEADSAGRIFVLDREANELRIFDSRGSHIRTTGGSGGGPGEFASAHGLAWMPGHDSLLIVDGRGHRYSIFDGHGNFGRSVARPLTTHAYMFHGGFANGLLYEEGVKQGATVYHPILIGVRLGAQPELVDTVFLKPPSVVVPAFAFRNSRGGGSYLRAPFAPENSWRMSSDSTFWWGFGSEYKIFELNLRGDTLRQVRANRQAVPVSEADHRDWENTSWVKSYRAQGVVLDLSRLPKTKPYFTDLLVDDRGLLWVEVSTADRLTAYDIFDRQGRLLGQLSTGLRRPPYGTYVQPLIRDGRLYVVGLNEMDVPFVFIFRVQRP